LEDRAFVGCASEESRAVEISRAIENEPRVRTVSVGRAALKNVQQNKARSIGLHLKDSALAGRSVERGAIKESRAVQDQSPIGSLSVGGPEGKRMESRVPRAVRLQLEDRS